MNQMNEKHIWIIMQARVGSTRLPAKVLKKICGKTVLEHDIERCLRVMNASGLIVATTTEPEASQIVDICSRYPGDRLRVYKGSINDVLGRYSHAAEEFGVDIIVRITSDCPLLDPYLVYAMIDRFKYLRRTENAPDYLCNTMPPTFPHGLDTEIFTFEALKKAFKEAKDPHEREHVTPYIRNHPELFQLANFSQEKDLSHHRWTLDYPEDFEFIKEVYQRLYPENPEFSTDDVLKLLEKEPKLKEINKERRQR